METKAMVYRLVQQCLALQHQLHLTDDVVTWSDEGILKKLHLHLVQLAQVCCEHLYDDHQEKKHTSIELHCSLLLRSIEFIISRLKHSVDKVANFYGMHEQSIYEKEMCLFIDYIKDLSDCVSSKHNKCCHIDSFLPYLPQHSHGTSHSMYKHHNVNLNSYHMSFILYWHKHHQFNESVSWADFSKAFTSEYGIQLDEVMTKFYRNYLHSTQPHLSSPSFWDTFDSNLPETPISFSNLLDLINKRTGQAGMTLFELYQELTYSDQTVVLCGSLVDNKIEYLTPTPIKQLLGLEIKQISCGDQHVCVITSEGLLYSWGKGMFGRLGHGNQEDCATPRLVSLSRTVPIEHVGCAFAYTGAVSREGVLYTWGAGINGRLGTGNGSDQWAPILIPVPEKVKSSVHSVVLSQSGQVYVMGKGDYHGHTSAQDILTPTLLTFPSPIQQVSISSGGFHTLVLTVTKEVWVWGHNRVGQLGLTNKDVKFMHRTEDGGYFIPTPTKIAYLPENIEIREVIAGWGHSFLLSTENSLFVCGRNAEGQLGVPDPLSLPTNERGHRYQPSFRKLEIQNLAHREIERVVCGGEYTLMQCSEGLLYGVGKSAQSQLGVRLDNQTHYSSPTYLSALNEGQREILMLSGSFYCCGMVVKNGRKVRSLRALCSDVIRNTPLLCNALTEGSAGAEEAMEIGDDDYWSMVKSQLI